PRRPAGPRRWVCDGRPRRRGRRPGGVRGHRAKGAGGLVTGDNGPVTGDADRVTGDGGPVRVAVIGCGAIGSLYAAHLARVPGVEVWAVDPWAEHVAAMQAQGLRVTGL